MKFNYHIIARCYYKKNIIIAISRNIYTELSLKMMILAYENEFITRLFKIKKGNMIKFSQKKLPFEKQIFIFLCVV